MARGHWLLAGLVVLAAAAAAAFMVTQASSSDPGPLVPQIDHKGVGYGVLLPVGRSESISGPLMVRNTSDHQLVLDKVQPLNKQDGLDFLGAYVLPYANALGYAPGYQVPADGYALPGATIAPHSDVELVVGVMAAKPGHYSFTAMDIVYHDRGATYRRLVPVRVDVCSSTKACS